MYIFRKSEALKKYKWDMMSIREERDVLLSIIIDHSKKERGSGKDAKKLQTVFKQRTSEV